MFAQIRQTYPDAQHVKGGSWLYNRVEYLRLFPPQFGVSARADAPHLHARGLWGQFLRHDNHVNEDIATQFVARLTELSDATAYQSCFPYQNLLTEAPISAFYQFYGAKIA